MLKYTNSFIEVSALGDFETEIQKLYNKLRRDATITSTRFEATPITEQDSTKDYLFSDILADVGRGKISTGLKSLELLSIIRTGTQPSNLFLFDNKIVYGTAASFNTAVSTDLVDIVLKNIGMYDIINNTEGDFSEFRGICLKIALKVKNGTYTSNIYSAYIKKESKKITKRYLNKWQA